MNELFAQAQLDESIALVVGDLGYGVVDDFAANLPDQFVNAGVSEQAMMSMAAGLAAAGRKVFVYSIANFPTLRCLEQIRNDVAHHNLDVSIVAVGAGLAYGNLGYTHHAVEDISVMRAITGIRVICPSDPLEAVGAVNACLKEPGPTYVRLGKNGESQLHSSKGTLDITEPLVLRDGSDAVIAATGAIASECLKAADNLKLEQISAQVWSIPTIKPFPVSWLESLDDSLPLVSVEEHVRDGGFGSAFLEALNDIGKCRLMSRVAISPEHYLRTGGQSFLREHYGISHVQITDAVRALLR